MGLITPEHPEAPEPTDAEVVADLHRDCVLKYPAMAARLDSIGDKIKNNKALSLMDAAALSGAAAHLRGPAE